MNRLDFLLTLIGAASLGAGPALASETCCGSSGLQDDRIFSIGESHPFENLGVRERDYRRNGGWVGLNDSVFADGAAGQYRIRVKFEPQVDNWSRGTMQEHAVTGEIPSFAIGSMPTVVDDVCITPNAP